MNERIHARLVDVSAKDPIPAAGTKADFFDRFVDLLIIYARCFHWDSELDPSTRLKLAQQDAEKEVNEFIGRQCSLEIKQKTDAERRQKEGGAE